MRLRQIVPVFALALLGIGAACDTAEEEAIETEPIETAPVTMTGDEMEPMMMGGTAELDNTINALQGDLTAIPMSNATGMIQDWQTRLQAANNPALNPIAENLGELQEELQESPIDGDDVGELLMELGQQTMDAASAADPGMTNQLQQLGNLLMQAGQRLTGGM